MTVTNSQCGPHPLRDPPTFQSICEHLQFLSELGLSGKMGTSPDRIEAMMGCVEGVLTDLQQLAQEQAYKELLLTLAQADLSQQQEAAGISETGKVPPPRS